MGDDERRPAGHQLGHALLQTQLGQWVDARRRLVEHEEIGVAEPDAGQREQLRLARGQAGASGTEGPVQVSRGELVEPGALERDPYLVVAGGGVEQCDVVAQRPVEQLDLLGH